MGLTSLSNQQQRAYMESDLSTINGSLKDVLGQNYYKKIERFSSLLSFLGADVIGMMFM